MNLLPGADIDGAVAACGAHEALSGRIHALAGDGAVRALPGALDVGIAYQVTKGGGPAMVPLDMLAAWTAGAYARARGRDPERGDVPGWVMVTVMTAGLVVVIFAVFRGK